MQSRLKPEDLGGLEGWDNKYLMYLKESVQNMDARLIVQKKKLQSPNFLSTIDQECQTQLHNRAKIQNWVQPNGHSLSIFSEITGFKCYLTNCSYKNTNYFSKLYFMFPY